MKKILILIFLFQTSVFSQDLEKAYFAGGCFWCMEESFEKKDGVTEVISGYSGGKTKNPTYEEVCTGETGHAEAVKISYDETKTTLGELLKIFFKTHDPTTRNRQGNDTGTQYRSVIFYDDENQLNFLEDYIETLDSSDTYNSKIVTTLEKKTEFFIAEEYHHNYFEKNPFNGYCNVVVRPKVEKFRKQYKA